MKIQTGSSNLALTPQGVNVPSKVNSDSFVYNEKPEPKIKLGKVLGAVVGAAAGGALGLISPPFSQFTGAALGSVGGGFTAYKAAAYLCSGMELGGGGGPTAIVDVIMALAKGLTIGGIALTGALGAMYAGICGGKAGSVIAGALGGAVIGQGLGSFLID